MTLPPAAPGDGPVMTQAAWIFLGLAWFAVTALAAWCFRRVLGGGRKAP